MRTLSPDTDPAAERVQTELLRQAGSARRLQMALQLTAATLELAHRAIARAEPELSEDERKVRFVELHYGAELAEGVRAAFARRRP